MLYFGPETYVPLASAAAALTGLILTFWRRLVGLFRRLGAGGSTFRRAASPARRTGKVVIPPPRTKKTLTPVRRTKKVLVPVRRVKKPPFRAP